MAKMSAKIIKLNNRYLDLQRRINKQITNLYLGKNVDIASAKLTFYTVFLKHLISRIRKERKKLDKGVK